MSRSIRLSEVRGTAIVGLMILAVIVLGSILMVNTSALLTMGNTSRALDMARQNAALVARLESLTREAAQNALGVQVANAGSFAEALMALAAEGSLGGFDIKAVQITSEPTRLTWFPDRAGQPAPLQAPSSDLVMMANPTLSRMVVSRGVQAVAESPAFSVRYSVERRIGDVVHLHDVEVTGRLLSVPITRHGLMNYELPVSIGEAVSSEDWPEHIAAGLIGPLGLVEGRDPASIRVLNSGAGTGGRTNRPGHYRYLAAQADAYQYIFSETYIQRVADFAGRTHFVLVGAGLANPVLEGGTDEANTYSLDVGKFGRGTLGAETMVRSVLVIHAADGGRRVVLRDSGGRTDPILIVAAGPGGVSPVGPLELAFDSDLHRPVVIVGYNVLLSTDAPRRINGALLLDSSSSTAAEAGPFTVGHLSRAGGSAVSADAFRLDNMPADAEALSPRVAYAVTAGRFL